MKFNFQLFINSILLYSLITFLVAIVLTLLGNTVLWTVFNAIFGEEKGLYVTETFMRSSLFLIVFAIAEIFNIKTASDKNEYLKSIDNYPYIFKDDLVKILKTGKFVNQCIAMSVIIIGFVIISRFVYILPLIFVFFIANLLVYTSIHKRWCKTRLHS